MSTSNMVLVAVAVAVSIGLLIWAVDFAILRRWFGEAPSWYWHQRWAVRQTVGALLDVSQIYAVVGIGFICLSMWAHRHPHIRQSNNWPPSGWGFVAVDSRYAEPEPEDPPVEWGVTNAGGNGRTLAFERHIYDGPRSEGFWSEAVDITARPYWAWHVWPRTFYRLKVGFVGTDAFHNPASDKNKHVSTIHPGARVDVTFRSGSATFGPMRMEKWVDQTSGVSYNYGAIRKLLEFLEKHPGPLKVHVDLSLNGKPVGTRDFETPDNLTAKKVADTTSVWKARR